MLGIMAAAAVLMAGSAAAQDKNKDKAMQIFVAQKCTQCHSIAGKGSKKGALDDVGKKLTAAQIREWLVDPVGTTAKTTPPPTRKPPMKKKAIPGTKSTSSSTISRPSRASAPSGRQDRGRRASRGARISAAPYTANATNSVDGRPRGRSSASSLIATSASIA